MRCYMFTAHVNSSWIQQISNNIRMNNLHHCSYCEKSYVTEEKKKLHEKICSFNTKTPSQRFKEKLGKAHVY